MQRAFIMTTAAGAAGAAVAINAARHDRDDCPGKIVCPVTGELICKDECPVEAGRKLPVNESECCCSGSAQPVHEPDHDARHPVATTTTAEPRAGFVLLPALGAFGYRPHE